MVASSARSELVGRERELADLEAGLDDALAGRGRSFLIRGEPGIGKTRLADEIALVASQRGARALWGRCSEAGGAPAYWPWVQILRSVVLECDPQALASQPVGRLVHVAQILPELRDRLPEVLGPPLPPVESEHARFYLFDAVTCLLK
ncbi:MAG: AAA family ATPase, partial [Candidatus Binatia bacterium]